MATNAQQQAWLIDASQLPSHCHTAVQRPAVTTTGAAGDATDLRCRDAPQPAALGLAQCRTLSQHIAPFPPPKPHSLQGWGCVCVCYSLLAEGDGDKRSSLHAFINEKHEYPEGWTEVEPHLCPIGKVFTDERLGNQLLCL